MILLFNITLLAGLVLIIIGYVSVCIINIIRLVKKRNVKEKYVKGKGCELGVLIKYQMIIGAVMALGSILILIFLWGADAIIISKMHVILACIVFLPVEVWRIFMRK